jgi:hypothetical protein
VDWLGWDRGIWKGRGVLEDASGGERLIQYSASRRFWFAGVGLHFEAFGAHHFSISTGLHKINPLHLPYDYTIFLNFKGQKASTHSNSKIPDKRFGFKCYWDDYRRNDLGSTRTSLAALVVTTGICALRRTRPFIRPH